MIGLNLFWNVRLILLMLLCTACAPAMAPLTRTSFTTAAGKSAAPVMVAGQGNEKVAGLGDALGDELDARIEIGAARDLPSLQSGDTRIYATQVALPTYPVEAYQSVAFDPVYRWPYLRFDRERFQAEAPFAEIRHYELLVLENEYLQVSILPELGGRIWQVVHKPSGDTMFYQNSVVKPSPWGPPNQLGWLAAGGLEWALPVNEHGYDWGTAWEVTTFQDEDGSVGAAITTPVDGRLLAAEIVVTLHPRHAYLSLAPTIRNLADHALDFHFWQTAMLAPGPDSQLSADLRFVSPSPIMSIHSTGDTMLPGPGRLFTWPNYFGRDLSRLGNWDRYVGFFEYPTAHGPFVGVYDPTLDAGAVRIYPSEVVQGSKVFGLGWRNAIGSEDFTDDDSAYVELHGGLSPTFDEPYTLAGGGEVRWQESWYPVHGIGNMVYANQTGALNLARTTQGLRIGLYPTEALVGTLQVLMQEQTGRAREDQAGAGQVMAEFPVTASPAAPFVRELDSFAPDAAVTLRLLDPAGEILLEYSSGDELYVQAGLQ